MHHKQPLRVAFPTIYEGNPKGCACVIWEGNPSGSPNPSQLYQILDKNVISSNLKLILEKKKKKEKDKNRHKSKNLKE